MIRDLAGKIKEMQGTLTTLKKEAEKELNSALVGLNDSDKGIVSKLIQDNMKSAEDGKLNHVDLLNQLKNIQNAR